MDIDIKSLDPEGDHNRLSLADVTEQVYEVQPHYFLAISWLNVIHHAQRPLLLPIQF